MGTEGLFIIPNVVSIKREGNPYWPLPPDYPSLTIAGKKHARLNACCMQSTRDEFVAAWNFFRTYYLASQGRAWYVHGFKPSPKEHFLMVGDIAQYSLNALGAPRSFAKSTVVGEEVPLWLSLTRPNFAILLYLAAQKFLSKRFDRFMFQLEENPRILEDFGYVPHHPLAEAYQRYKPTPHERPTWDLTSVLYAVFPKRGYFELSPPGQVTVEQDGFTRFAPDPAGRHRSGLGRRARRVRSDDRVSLEFVASVI